MGIVAREEATLQTQVAQAGRNASWPCGSGCKVKQCLGYKLVANGQIPSRLPDYQARSRPRIVAVSDRGGDSKLKPLNEYWKPLGVYPGVSRKDEVVN
jgi:hypothetical protein